MKTSPSASWHLERHHVSSGCLPRPLYGSSAYPGRERPGRLSPSSSSASVLDVEVMNRARIWSAAERGLLHEVARAAELGAGRSAAGTDSAPCTLAHRASSRGAPTVPELTILDVLAGRFLLDRRLYLQTGSLQPMGFTGAVNNAGGPNVSGRNPKKMQDEQQKAIEGAQELSPEASRRHRVCLAALRGAGWNRAAAGMRVRLAGRGYSLGGRCR